ncbi:MAG: shikimate kinase [Muribaculaceae bacterium]|nr:shikimate kinase [Muribaculaceae bacterium]
MASGKSTLGRALAARLGDRPFIDLDSEVEAAEGMSVAEIFAARGESHFRRAEADALRRVASVPGAVVACGGGTPCRPQSMDLMLESGIVVWLKADPATTLRRLLDAPPGQRPKIEHLRANPGQLRLEIERMEELRRPHYSRAPHVFCSDRLETQEQIDQSVSEFIRLFNIRP